MPIEDWVQRWAAAKFLYDWQTFIAGVFAVGAAVGTILATVWSANREIKASQEQTTTTVQLAQMRDFKRSLRVLRHARSGDGAHPRRGGLGYKHPPGL